MHIGSCAGSQCSTLSTELFTMGMTCRDTGMSFSERLDGPSSSPSLVQLTRESGRSAQAGECGLLERIRAVSSVTWL